MREIDPSKQLSFDCRALQNTSLGKNSDKKLSEILINSFKGVGIDVAGKGYSISIDRGYGKPVATIS